MSVSLNEDTYIQLKRDIMTFVFPPGEAISAQKIATKYNVSRTPAREAIVKLEKEGLLNIYPKAYTRVAKINIDRASEEWFVRLNLEIGMSKLFIQNCTSEVLQALEAQLELLQNAGESSELSRVELDNQFHRIIYECSGQYLAKEIIETHMTHYNRIRYLAELNENISYKSDQEHKALIEAARNHDEADYEKLIKQHVRRIIEDQENVINRNPEFFEV